MPREAPAPPEPGLGRWPLAVEIPVAWGDMDAFGHVNNAVFVRWFETARVDYLIRAGLMGPRRPDGAGPILARVAVDYRAPVDYPDTVRAEATAVRFGHTSVSMRQRVTSLSTRALVAEGDAIIVMLDYRTGARVALDEGMKRRILDLEARGVRTPA